MSNLTTYIVGVVLGTACAFLIAAIILETQEKEMWKDAFENGAAVREIVDDEIIYRWREYHK